MKRKIIAEDSIGMRRYLGWLRLWREDYVKKLVEPKSQWRERAEDWDKWQYVYLYD